MKITDIKATTVTMPLEAPLRHSNGAHWGRFVRTVVEVETDEGITGLGEMGGGGESAERAFAGLKTYLVGHDPFELERMRFAICNPTASLYNNRTQLHAALEFACLDIMGKKLGVPVYDLLGGRVRERVGFASYLFFRYANPETGEGEVRTADQLVAEAAALKAKHGFTAHKLKGGVFPPDYELECFRAHGAISAGRGCPLRSQRRLDARPGDPLRPCHRGSAQRLSRRSRPTASPRCGGCARRCGCRWRPTPSSSISSSSPPTFSIPPSTSSCSTRRSGAASGPASRRLRSATRSASASPCIPRASSASSSRRCCISAPSCPISASPPTRITTISSTTSSSAASSSIATA